ncbi:MAG: LON peptidase substrate-binding domain-containing protein [Vicinamibacterales bacterium]
MSDLLPLFPLPNVVLFPNVFLPLHIFEPRYREMTADAVAGDRLIGMVLLRPGWEVEREQPPSPLRGSGAPGRSSESEGRPPIYSIGCSGLITHVEALADGRYNIVLRGLERVRILQEDHTRSYRQAVVESLHEAPLQTDDRAVIRRYRERLEAMLAAAGGPTVRQGSPSTPAVSKGSRAADPKIPAAMGDEDLVNALAQYLDLEPVEKQALLERHSLRARAASLVELLEMKMIIARSPGLSKVAH